jgi:hypothetical protein
MQQNAFAHPTMQRREHREEVARAQKSLQSFIECLRQLPYREGTYTLSMDLYAAFEANCGIDLPEGFQIEFGRQINKACRDGRLTFRRKTVTRASIAAWEGLDESDLMMLLVGDERGA